MPSDNLFQPAVGLVAVQFLLYAAGWALASRLLPRRQRSASLHWAGFMLLLGLAFWLTSQRGEPRQWPAYAGSSIAFIGSFLLLWRGLEAFVSAPPRNREQLALLALGAVPLALLGADQAYASLRTFIVYGLGAVIFVRLLVVVFSPMAAEFPRRVVYAVALPAFGLALAFGSRAMRQAVDWQEPIEMNGAVGGNISMLFGYLIGGALFNFSFIALVTLRAVNALRHLSRHDGLTGVLNRRAFDEALRTEWLRAQRTGNPFSVVLLDLDHFKQVNDRLGHQAGDQVLVHVAQQLRAVARSSDLVARYGGEEFVLVLPGIEAAGAEAAAQRLLRQLRAAPLRVGDVDLVVTASAGVAQVGTGTGTGDVDGHAALRRADAALYRAKAAGRDRVLQG